MYTSQAQKDIVKDIDVYMMRAQVWGIELGRMGRREQNRDNKRGRREQNGDNNV